MKNHRNGLFISKKESVINPCRNRTEKYLVNVAIMITLVYFLFMVSGCSYYRAVTSVKVGEDNIWKETINKLYPENKYPRAQYPETNLEKMFLFEYQLFVVDSEGSWQLSEAVVINDTIYATAVLYPAFPETLPNIPPDGTSVRYYPNKESDLLKRIFIYTEKVKFIEDGKAYFPVQEILQIKTFKDHPAAKVGMTFLILGGVVTVALIIAFFVSIVYAGGY